MLCRYYIQTGTGTVDVKNPRCLDCSELIANLGDIKMSYSRAGSDTGGVIRKTTSQLSLIGEARELILAEYRENYLQSTAAFAVYVADNNWEFHEAFSCPLDFSSLQYDEYTAKINCIDNSAEALIKANKTTEYEYLADELANGEAFLDYDRVLVANNWEWQVIGTTGDDMPKKDMTYADIDTNPFTLHKYMPYFPSVGNVDGNVPRNSTVEILDQDETADWLSWKERNEVILPDTGFIHILKDCYIHIEYDLTMGFRSDNAMQKIFASGSSVEILLTVRHADGKGEIIPGQTTYKWPEGPVSDGPTVSFPGNKTWMAYLNTGRYSGTVKFMKDDKLQLCVLVKMPEQKSDPKIQFFTQRLLIIEPKIEVTWNERGDTINIKVSNPLALLNKMLADIGGTKMKMTGAIKETVDGKDNDRLKYTKLVAAESVRGMEKAKFHSSFSSFCDFMSAVFGYVYKIDENADHTEATVTFLHRTEIYDPEVVKTVENVSEPSCKVDSSNIYSTVEIGYDKQSYDSGNTGKDEFNFYNTYSTGVTLKEKKLELKSPYRADCYGIEELVNKRSSDDSESTDSDNDIFLVRVAKEKKGNDYVPDRSATVSGVFSDTVFNAELSPLYMIKANEAYLGIFSDKLKYTSAIGNSEAVINGTALNSDIKINKHLMRAATLTFKTDDMELPSSWEGLVAFDWDGRRYMGYLDNLDIKYHQPEALEYSLYEAVGSVDAGSYVLTVEPSPVRFRISGGTVSLKVTSTKDGKPEPYSIDGLPEWLSLGDGDALTCEANDQHPREGSFTVSQPMGGETITVQVKQGGTGFVFEADTTLATVPAHDKESGGFSHVTIEITSLQDDMKIGYMIIQRPESWVRIERSILDDNAMRLTVMPNGTLLQRETRIILRQYGSGKELELTIRQLGG